MSVEAKAKFLEGKGVDAYAIAQVTLALTLAHPLALTHMHSELIVEGGAQVPLTDAHRRPLTPLYPSPTLTPTLVLTLTCS